MKKTNIIYWIITGLFSLFMLFSAIPDVMVTPEAKTFMNGLGYPDYITRFLGIAKILGIIAILIPGYQRVKDWAYIGLFYDLFGATYSIVAVSGVQPQTSIMLLPLIFWGFSYFYYNKRKNFHISSHHKNIVV